MMFAYISTSIKFVSDAVFIAAQHRTDLMKKGIHFMTPGVWIDVSLDDVGAILLLKYTIFFCLVSFE